MKNNIIIFHGTGGSSKGNWFPWLKKQLELQDYRVFVPQFPNPDVPNFPDWLKKFDEYKKYINNETVLIGHSLGGLFLLRILERLEKPVKAAIFISAPIGAKPIRYYDSDKRFSGFSFNWGKIKKNAKHFEVFHSDNDPYVCLDNGKKLSKKLNVILNFVPNAGHLNAESGYTKFPSLLEKVKQII